MQIAQRFTLLVKGGINAVFDSLEDPERSLNQLVLDMEEELEAAKRAVAGAMANEDRLRSQIAFHHKDGAEWEEAAKRALAKGREADARQALKRAEMAERQRDRLQAQLDRQSGETEECRESVVRMHERLGEARSRLQLVQAQLRQARARRRVGEAMRGIEHRNLHCEFDRLSDRVASQSAADRAYLRLDDELRGDDVRRRFEASAVDDAVEDRLAALREGAQQGDGPSPEGEDREAKE